MITCQYFPTYYFSDLIWGRKLTCGKVELFKCHFCSVVKFMKLNIDKYFQKFMNIHGCKIVIYILWFQFASSSNVHYIIRVPCILSWLITILWRFGINTCLHQYVADIAHVMRFFFILNYSRRHDGFSIHISWNRII